MVSALAAMLAWAAVANAQTSLRAERMLIVTTDMTPEGRKVAPPTAERPTYYVPVSLGYSETGDVAQHFQRKPAEEPILEAVVAALAKRHYLMASREFPPTMTITFEWGTITPVYNGQSVINAGEIRQRALGEYRRDLVGVRSGLAPEMMNTTGRHFLTISAFAYQRKVTKESPDILLWRSFSSTDHWGNFLDDVVQPLIAKVTPALGRATKPEVSWYDRQGKVEVGDPIVRENDVK